MMYTDQKNIYIYMYKTTSFLLYIKYINLRQKTYPLIFFKCFISSARDLRVTCGSFQISTIK